MNLTDTEDADVVVVGGGPAGATLASLCAMQGHRVVVLEKEKFPRYQIGESLLPSTIHGICRMIGVSGELAKAGFVRKRGGTFKWGTNPEPWTFSFSISSRTAGETSYAYQVERRRFDKIMLDNARIKGADVRENTSVSNVLIDGERVRGVTYVNPSGTEGQITAKFVIDASGNKSRLHKHVGGSRQYSEFFRNVALFGYFDGAKRLAPPNSGNILCAAFKSGWFWYIPLSDTLTSVGAVVRRELADKVQGDPEKALRGLIDECPMIAEYLRDAKRSTDGEYAELRVRKDYSYHNTKVWRPGMALIGDAACFVDPVFSSGVHLATYSALLAARSVNSVLAGKVDEDAAFREFEQRYRREYSVFYEFLMSFYDMHVSEDSYFWSAKKITKETSSEVVAFVNLVGGLASGEDSLIASEPLSQRLKSGSEEFASAVDEIVANKEQSMVPLFKSTVVRQAMQESGQVQSLAILGEDTEGEAPLFDGGLVPSGDGMFWVAP